MQAISVERTGGPEVLAWGELPDPAPGTASCWCGWPQRASTSSTPTSRQASTPGSCPSFRVEGAGTVEAVGPGVEGVRPGNAVAWADGGSGSYAELVRVPADRAVPVPAGVQPPVAAAALLQGMTAHFLSHDTYPLARGNRCLIQAAAGGVGLLLVQMAKAAGAEVFATVGSAEKGELARGAGADHADPLSGRGLRHGGGAHCRPATAGRRLRRGRPRDVERGLDLLRPRGMMVTFGNASGPVDPVSPLTLMNSGSLFLTRPTLRHYVATAAELRERAGAVLGAVAAGELDVRIGATLPLAEARRAHELLEGRGTTGKVLLLP